MVGDISWMVGQSLSEIRYRDPGNWWLHFANGGSLHTESAWRFLVAGRIKLTSQDHGQWFGLPAPVNAEAELWSLLSGKTVQTAEIRDETHDMIITFDSDWRLEIVTLSSAYEIWISNPQPASDLRWRRQNLGPYLLSAPHVSGSGMPFKSRALLFFLRALRCLRGSTKFLLCA
jgi:hypothetical protein